jgi:TIR domain
LLTAVSHLANHGYVALLRTSQGEDRILLASELLNNVAASIVLEARRNPRGLGSIEERKLLAGEYDFSELNQLSTEEKGVLLDSAVSMFLKHNVCFRQTDPLGSRGFLVFPELIRMKKPRDEGGPVEDGPTYSVTGSTQNLYASLVVLLGYTSTFTRANQWRDEARYVVGDGLTCGFRLENESEGELSLVLFFGADVGLQVRNLFQSLFENFLSRRDVIVRRYEPLHCANGHRLNASVIREQIDEGSDEVFCMKCGWKVSLFGVSSAIEETGQQVKASEAQRNTATERSVFEQALFKIQTYVSKAGIRIPSCFISYAWGDKNQESWVERDLAADLTKAGIDVILDKWENARVGASIPRFVDRVGDADFVVVVGTPPYRTKYMNKESMRGYVVAAEGDLIGKRLIGSEVSKGTVLPTLLEGSEEISLPPLLQGKVFADFRPGSDYFITCLNLILTIYQIPFTSTIASQLVRALVQPPDIAFADRGSITNATK